MIRSFARGPSTRSCGVWISSLSRTTMTAGVTRGPATGDVRVVPCSTVSNSCTSPPAARGRLCASPHQRDRSLHHARPHPRALVRELRRCIGPTPSGCGRRLPLWKVDRRYNDDEVRCSSSPRNSSWVRGSCPVSMAFSRVSCPPSSCWRNCVRHDAARPIHPGFLVPGDPGDDSPGHRQVLRRASSLRRRAAITMRVTTTTTSATSSSPWTVNR